VRAKHQPRQGSTRKDGERPERLAVGMDSEKPLGHGSIVPKKREPAHVDHECTGALTL